MDPAPGAGRTGPIEQRLAHAGLPPLPRLTWLEIDLDVLAANARCLRGLLPPGARLGVVVKADGYGHGLVAAARAATRGGADLLVVATLDEALVLRSAGVADRILVLYPVPPTRLGDALDAGLDLVVADEDSVRAMVGHLQADGRRTVGSPGAAAPRVHLGIDTGLSRGGIAPDLAAEAAGRLLDAGLGRLAGTWSHLAAPDDAASVAAQVERFELALAALGAAGIEPGVRHLDATGGLVGGAGPAYDLVRVGLAFYGVLPPELGMPEERATAARSLRPAMTLRARATTVTTIAAGARVGYAGTWTATRPSVVATIGLGYADGWARAYAAGSWGVTHGLQVPVIGRVSSDALALDVTDVPGFGGDDEIVLLGDHDRAMTVHDLSAMRGSIAWEVLDAFTPRLSRVYLETATPVGVRYLDGSTTWS